MKFKQFFYENLEVVKPIIAHYMSVDGFTKEKVFTGPDAKENAKKFVEHYIGLNGEIEGHFNYIVSFDGIGRVAIKGIDIYELLGREAEKLKSESSPGYASSLAYTALTLNAPILLAEIKKNSKFEKFYKDGSFIYDWFMPSKDKLFPKNPEQWRFIFSCRFDKIDGNMRASISIFYYDSRDEQHRVLDDDKEFESNGNKDDDLEVVESVLNKGKNIIDAIEEHIRSSRIKIDQ